MRVLYLISHVEARSRQHALFEHIALLKERGWEATVASFGCPPFFGLVQEIGATTRALQPEPAPTLTRGQLLPFVKAVRAFTALIRAERPDVVHLNDISGFQVGLIAAKIARSPVVLQRHLTFTPPKDRISKMFYGAVPWAFAITEAVRSDLIAAGCRPRRISVVYIPAGVNWDGVPEGTAELRTSIAGRADATIITIVGRISPEKGHITFLRALGQLADQNIVALIAGDVLPAHGYDPSYNIELLQKTAAEVGVERVVRFLGWREDIPSVLAATDILVVPSLREALGGVVLEGCLAGRCVVASRVGGIPEIIEDGVSGRLVPPGDAEALGSVLRELVEHPGLRAEFARAARNRYLRLFAPERYIERVEAGYRQVMDART